MTSALRVSCIAAVAALAAGCAPEFDRVSEIETLRILAVQKDKPYVTLDDGDETTVDDDLVKLRMLWRDAPDKAGRPIQLQWFGGCFNPPGDLFFSCFAPQLQFVPEPVVNCPGPAGEACNNEFSLRMPPTILDRPPSADPTQPEYGLAYVFFAICAGELRFVTPQNERDFPYGCFDANDNRLGSDDFVAGYSAIYAYRDRNITNGNPEITGFFFKDEEVGPGCEGDGCLDFRCVGEECLDLHCAGPSCRDLEQEWSQAPCGQIPCVAPCEDDGEDTCPPNKIRPKLTEPLSGYPELDVISNLTRGRSITEQMWINYYAEAGGVKSEVRLLNDAFAGVNDDFGTEFYAPKEKPKENGLTLVWAVVHDNRGGLNWVGIPVRVQ